MRLSLQSTRWLPIVLAGLVFFTLHPQPTAAASLTTLRDYLIRQQANLASGQVHQFFFTPATSLAGSGNLLQLEFPIPDSGDWCHTAGDLAVSGLSDPEGTFETATALPGSLTAVCTVGNFSTTGDRLTVSAIDPLTAGTKYGVRLSDGTIGRLGTPDPANGILVNVKTNDGVIDIDTGVFWTVVLANDRVTISATVSTSPEPPSNPTVEFRGRSSLDTTVNFFRDGTLIQTVPTDPAAKFDVTLANQSAGQHVYDITSNDAEGREHASLTFALNLSPGSTTLITGVFLGPTIEVDHTVVDVGDPVTIFGKTAPNSTITLTVESDPVIYNFSADGEGDWSKAFNTSVVGVGDHTATAQALSTDNTMSETSLLASFSVNALGPCAGKPTADLNCDDEVNLTDFSILLFFWQQANPANARADINTDGRVTIVDFSIMLFQWTA